MLSEEFDGTKLQDISFQWIPLSSLCKEDFTSQYLSSFNFQILSYCSETIAKKLFDTDLANDISKLSFYPDIAVLKVDPRQTQDHYYETMARGEWICGHNNIDPEEERWSFYNVYDFQYPSEAELSKLRAIIIPGSDCSVLDLDKIPWMAHLAAFIKKVYEDFKHIKLLGISFGH